MYQHAPPDAPGFDAERFRKFAGAELEDFLLARALECFADGWSQADVRDRVCDWNTYKAQLGAFLDDAEVEAIVARAEKVAPTAPANVAANVVDNVVAIDSHPAARGRRGSPKRMQITRPGYSGPPLEVEVESARE